MTGNADPTDLSKGLGYEFKDPELLAEAFRHSSYVNESENAGLKDNERLEFLGDAVLDLAISDILMGFFQNAKEGELSKCRASVVNEKVLSHLARELRVGAYLLLGKGEELSGGREKPSILANTLEALLGAIYLDADFSTAREIIHRLFLPFLGKLDVEGFAHDYKSLLQEHTQDKFKSRPEYALVSEAGPAHEKTFRVSISLQGRLLAEGEGRSKKEAEQTAAQEALLCLKRGQENP
jgi:ribonuclease III